MKLISTTIAAVPPGGMIVGPDGDRWEVFSGQWIASASGDWQLVNDPNTRVLWCIYEEPDAIAAVAAHFTIESMEIIENGP